MGKTGIRTVCKVDFDKPASEQPYLHVSFFCSLYHKFWEEELGHLRTKDAWLTQILLYRTDGILTVRLASPALSLRGDISLFLLDKSPVRGEYQGRRDGQD